MWSTAVLLFTIWLGPAWAQRNVSVFMQALINGTYLMDPDLNLPFTSMLYISAGADPIARPPLTARMATLSSDNGTLEADPSIVLMEHHPNFTLPTGMSMANGLAWKEIPVGTIADDITSNPLFTVVLSVSQVGTVGQHAPPAGIGTYGISIVIDTWRHISEQYNGRYHVGVADENQLMKLVVERLIDTPTDGTRQFAKIVNGKYPAKFTIDAGAGSRFKPGSVNALVWSAKTKSGQSIILDVSKPLPLESTSRVVRGIGYVRASGTSPSVIRLLEHMEGPNLAVRAAKTIQPTDALASLKDSKPVYSEAKANICTRDMEKRGRCSATVYRGELKTDLAFVRQGGVFSTVTLVSHVMAQATIGALILTGAAFILLDFIKGNWVGGMMGIAAMTLGIGLPLALAAASPIGWILGGIIIALFAFLPMLGKPTPLDPFLNSTQQIVQKIWWNDRNITGNEKCTKDQGTPCVAAYGPGVISLAFGWTYYEAAVLMIHSNQGLSMSIPDIADALGPAKPYRSDYSPTTALQVVCDNVKDSAFYHDPYGGPGYWLGSDPSLCRKAKVSINLNSIVLPNLNQTAGQIIHRIYPDNPNGDCKVTDQTGVSTIPKFGFTARGFPVSISCNITKGVGPVNELDSSNNITIPTGSSPGQASTGGRPGLGYVPPPPSKPWTALNSSNAACFTVKARGPFCLLNGTYSSQTGIFGFKQADATGVTFPEGGQLKVKYFPDPYYWAVIPARTATWTNNQTYDPKHASGLIANDFSLQMRAMGAQPMPQLTFDVLIPGTSPPSACFYTEAKYHGDAICMGVGGGQLPIEAKKIVSVAVYGSAVVTLFPNSYGDIGGQKFSVSVENVGSLPLGINKDFSGKVVAALIEDTSHGVIVK